MKPQSFRVCQVRLKANLVVTCVREGGIPYVDVLEPDTGRSFRFYEHEYLLAKELQPGKPYDELVRFVARRFGFETTPEAIDEFIRSVAEMGFLDQAEAEEETVQPLGEKAGKGTSEETPEEGVARSEAFAAALAVEDALGRPGAGSAGKAHEAVGVAVRGAAAVPAATAAPAAAPVSARAAAAGARDVQGALASHAPRMARRGFPLRWLLVPVVLLVVALALLVVLLRQERVVAPEETLVRAVPVRLENVTRVYAEARLIPLEPALLGFREQGKVMFVSPLGKRVEAGEVIAKLEGADRILKELEHAQEREAFYRLKLEGTKDKATLRFVEKKVNEKQELVAAYSQRYESRVLRSPGPGILAAVLVRPGEAVGPEKPVVRFAPLGFRADFQVEMPLQAFRQGQSVEILTAAEKSLRVSVEKTELQSGVLRVGVILPPIEGLKEGERVRLVRTRFENVVRVPATAIVRAGDEDTVFVAEAREGAFYARARQVVVVDREKGEALVARGLHSGEQLIVGGTQGMSEGRRVRVMR